MSERPRPIDNEQTPEIVPLDRARFLDRLEPQYEEQWQQLMIAGGKSKQSIDEFTMGVWNDRDMPQAIRDRALLLYVGKLPETESIGTYSGPGHMGMLWGLTVNLLFYGNNKQHPDLQELGEWLDSAMEYGPIVRTQIVWELSYKLFSAGLIDQAKFEKMLEPIDPAFVSPTYEGSGWGGDSYPLDPDRVPYLDDIILGVTASKDDVNLQNWAHQKFEDYLRNVDTDPETLPVWLRSAQEESVKKLIKNTYYLWARKEIELPGSVLAGIEKYGFDIVESPYENSRLISELKNMPQNLVAEYARWRFENYLQGKGALYETSRGKIIKRVEKPLPEDIAELYDRVIAKQRKEAEEKRKRDEAWHREYEEKAARDPEEIAKRRAQEQFKDLFSAFKNAEKFNP